MPNIKPSILDGSTNAQQKGSSIVCLETLHVNEILFIYAIPSQWIYIIFQRQHREMLA